MVERLEDGTLHARAFYSPASVRPSLFVDSNVYRLECEAGVGELFSGKRLEDGIA